jgi:hypothetical protein
MYGLYSHIHLLYKSVIFKMVAATSIARKDASSNRSLILLQLILMSEFLFNYFLQHYFPFTCKYFFSFSAIIFFINPDYRLIRMTYFES